MVCVFPGRAWAGIILIGFWLTPAAPAATRYVWTNSPGTNNNDYLTWDTAATNIQEAVFAAIPGDIVFVTNGDYCVTNQIIITNNITVQSVNGYSNTLVYAVRDPYTTRCVYVFGPSVVDGFTISNGCVDSVQGQGGGAYVAYGRIQNCYIVANVATGAWPVRGGGVYGGTLSNCTLTGNSADWGGGGACESTLYNCTLTDNSAAFGAGANGGILYNCTLISNSASGGNAGGGAQNSTLYNCGLTGNSSVVHAGGTYGGTLYNCTLTGNSAGSDGGGARHGSLSNCTLTGNSAGGYGGGADNCTLYNCTLISNSAGSTGGGVYGGTLSNCTLTGNSTDWGGGGARAATLYNCLLISNSAANLGGGALDSTLYNCTLTGNSAADSGGGVYERYVSTLLNNCIVYFNQASTSGPNWGCYSADKLSFTNCCTTPTNSLPGSGNITNEPMFMDISAGNCRLTNDSPCINSGTNQDWMITGVDLDGHRRLDSFFGLVDMGAYEHLFRGTMVSMY